MKVIFPSVESQQNDYLNNLCNLLEINKGLSLDKLNPVAILKLCKGSSRKQRTLILNWYEDKAIESRKKYIVFFANFIFCRLYFSKIVYVKHNVNPHNMRNVNLYNIMAFFLRLFSTDKITHRPIKGFKYIPHLPYEKSGLKREIISNEREVDYLCFGTVKKYKGIVELLESWDPECRLKLVGMCNNEELRLDIARVIQAKKLNVELDFRFLEKSELDDLLLMTKVVVLPHIDNSMIVSGAFYHASSFGCNIMVRDSSTGFSEYLTNTFAYVGKVGDDRPILNSEAVEKNFSLICSKVKIREAWEEVLN